MKHNPCLHGAGEIMENPNSGERFLWLQPTAQTLGRSLAFELQIAPGGARLGLELLEGRSAALDAELLRHHELAALDVDVLPSQPE